MRSRGLIGSTASLPNRDRRAGGPLDLPVQHSYMSNARRLRPAVHRHGAAATSSQDAGGIDETSVDANVELDVRAKADPSAAHSANLAAAVDILARRHPD